MQNFVQARRCTVTLFSFRLSRPIYAEIFCPQRFSRTLSPTVWSALGFRPAPESARLCILPAPRGNFRLAQNGLSWQATVLWYVEPKPAASLWFRPPLGVYSTDVTKHAQKRQGKTLRHAESNPAARLWLRFLVIRVRRASRGERSLRREPGSFWGGMGKC